jgi:hypothetical protein
MVKQMLKGLIYKLEASPALASKLKNFGGMGFDHMNLGSAKARMIITDGVVKLKVMTGSTTKDFHRKLDVLSM